MNNIQTLPLAGKGALATGAARGIGAAIALKLAEDSADVAITYEKSAEKADAHLFWQAARPIVMELGLREMTGRGRFRRACRAGRTKNGL